MRALLTERFGEGWERHASDPVMWKQVDDDPDDGGSGRSAASSARELVTLVQAQGRRRPPLAGRGHRLRPSRRARPSTPAFLTVGFARRLATYKRLNLLVHNTDARPGAARPRPARCSSSSPARPIPSTTPRRRSPGAMFDLKRVPEIGNRVVFIEDYDLSVAGTLIAGCDVWLNLPRPPFEASGTSGMKAALNGCLNLSVLDGWWMEAYDGSNGWAIDGDVDPDEAPRTSATPRRSTTCSNDEVRPLFYDRDDSGIPSGWLRAGPRLDAHPRAALLRHADARRLRRPGLHGLLSQRGARSAREGACREDALGRSEAFMDRRRAAMRQCKGLRARSSIHLSFGQRSPVPTRLRGPLS